ncbi:hypothetical protein KR018_012490 [Drosophila ironensis]|nr:hypothetical protein KR018_012490 [Drosophila ironensis]
MPFVDPFTSDVMDHFSRQTIRECSNTSDLVTSQFDFKTHRYRLHIHKHLAEPLLRVNGNASIECFYMKLLTNPEAIDDSKHKEPNKHHLTNHQLLPKNADFVITKCYLRKSKKRYEKIQYNAMSLIQDRLTEEQVRDFVEEQKVHPRPSVFIMGLDSTSRINLRRSMPLVYQYVSRPGWYEMQGYNKVGDNTFPNLVAFLTGNSEAGVESVCDLRKPGCLDKLPFIWKRFKVANYTTAFAEDCAQIDTFNYLKPGFQKQPTDYYLRPLISALEAAFPVTKDYGNAYCVGRHLSFSYVWDFGKQFIERFLGRSSIFGFLWSNSFTHDSFEAATALDKLFRKYLGTFEDAGLFRRSIVILMSDHGQRFKTLRQAASGYYEERMPMMFIYIPPWFRKMYPHLVKNLKANRNRLTSNYDMHMTLQHLLQLNVTSPQDFPTEHQAKACPTCQSLFFKVPLNRTCEMAGIEEKWCCCQPTVTVTKAPYVANIVEAIIRQMNEHLKLRKIDHLCAEYKLKKLNKADQKSILASGLRPADKDEHVYIIEFETVPSSPTFEATVRWNNRTQKLLPMDVDEISRLSSYKNDANCINIKTAKKYCICKDSIAKEN